MYKTETATPKANDFRTLAAILSGGSLTALGIGLFAFTIPLASLDERISGAWLGSAFACYYLAKLLVSPLSGMVSDRFGPRLVLLAAMLAGGLVPLAYFLFPGLQTLYAIQIAMGLVTGLIRPVGMATLAGSASGAALSRRFAIHAALFNASAFVGPVLGGLLYFNREMGPVLLALAACMGLAALVTAFLLPGSVSTIRQTPTGNTTEMCGNKGRASALLLAICGRTLGIGFLAAFYPIQLAESLGQSGLIVALTFAMPGLATFLGLIASGRFANKKPDPGQVVLGMLLSAGSLFALGECTRIWEFMTVGAVMGLGAALSIPASMALASTLTKRQGTVFGAANLAAGLGFLLGPLLGGLAVQLLHSAQPAMQLAALLGAFACLPLVGTVFYEQFHWSKPMSRIATGALALVLLFTMVMGTGLTPDDAVVAQNKDLYKFTDVAMGTIVNLTLEAHSRTAASSAARKTMEAMRALQQDFDFRNLDGSVGRINRNAGRSWVKPSPRVFALLERMIDLSAASDGVFDPTIGALTSSPLYFALDDAVARAKSDLVDYRLILLDRPGKRARLKKKGMALDLGGIAKGTIVDAAVALLRKQGIPAGIVEAGGDFYCFGERDWTVGIRHPRNRAICHTITVREKGVCGSGDYEQFITVPEDGRTVMRHHIIDPTTMTSADESIGVTVIAKTAEKADALATALFIMGPGDGAECLADHFHDSAAVWFLPDQSIIFTDNFPQ